MACPVVVSVITIAINIVVSVVFVRMMGFRGLALGTAIAALANGGTLLVLLRNRLHGLNGTYLSVTFAKTVAAGVATALVAFSVDHLMQSVAPGPRFFMQAVRLFASIGGGLAALALVAKILRISEFNDAIVAMRARLKRN